MSVLESSFTSQTHSPTRVNQHSLCQDLQQLSVKWSSQNLDRSKPDIESESDNENSIISPNEQNKLQNQPELEQGNKNILTPEGKSSLRQQQTPEEQENESPKTVTLIDELVSKQSFNASSKFTQYSSQVDNQSFATFLSIRQTSYETVIKSFQRLFENVSNLFGERIKNITQTYLSLIQIKYDQEKAYLSVNLGQAHNSRELMIYMNCKTVSDQIRIKLEEEKNRRKIYVQSLQDIKNSLEGHIESVSSLIKEKRAKIIKIHQNLTEIENEMSDLMIAENRKAKKKQINPQLYSNSFIRTKYLMGKERVYLSLIANYLERVLNFISYVCFELEPQNCLIVKESLLSYAQELSNYKPENKKILKTKIQALIKVNCFQQIYKQVSKLLELCVPESISPHNFHSQNEPKQYNEKQLKKIIESLISQSQTLVYIPVIELQSKDYAYHSRNKANVKWIRINHEQKYKENVEEIEVYVIVTHESHLVLELLGETNEKEEKMAILKLNQLKISRKGNQLFLTDCKKGVIGYLISTNAVLGSLTFQPLEGQENQTPEAENAIIQEFISSIKDVLDQRKQRKQRKFLNQ